MSVASPTNLKITPGVESLSLSWSLSGENLGGWLVHYRPKGVSAWTTVILEEAARSYSISHLQPETYEIQVRALVAGGIESATTTPGGKPTEPVGVPVLSVNGNAISWQTITGATAYEFATILNPTTTRETTYQETTATSITPPIVSGQTVNYGCKVSKPTSGEWAKEVSISYPGKIEPPPHEEEPPVKKEEPPIEPPPVSGVSNACLPGVCVNGGGTFAQAAQVGLKGGVGRVEGSMSALASQALAAGMQVDFLLASGTPSITGAISEYQALSSTLKPAIRCIEVGNESWPGGDNGSVTGKQYGECFVKASAEAKKANLPIPLLCQVRIANNVGDKWMEECFGVSGMKEALIGNGTASAAQHRLASHPYYQSMMVAPKEPTNLSNRKDVNGSEWGGNGWMKEQYYVLKNLGVFSSLAITEYGARFSGSLGSDDSVGSQTAQAVIGKECMAFAKLVKERKVPTAWLPGPSYTPALDFIAWYALFGNAKTSDTETFGLNFYPAEGGKNEPLYGDYKAGAEALTDA